MKIKSRNRSGKRIFIEHLADFREVQSRLWMAQRGGMIALLAGGLKFKRVSRPEI